MRTWYPEVTDDELERIAAFVAAYCDSELAQRIAALGGARPERPFAFEHDGVLLHGRLDVLHRDGGRRSSLDYKTNLLGDRVPDEIVEADYALQRLVYALACFRAGAEEVEVVYAFLERRRAVVSTTFTRADLAGLEAELSRRDRTDQPGRVRPDAERVHLLGLPGARSRLRRPAAGGGGWSPPREAARARPRRWRRATSRRRASRSGRSETRIGPIIERLAVEHADAQIALTFRKPARAARLGDALGADDRRERQPRDREAFEKYRRPEDYLAVPR